MSAFLRYLYDQSDWLTLTGIVLVALGVAAVGWALLAGLWTLICEPSEDQTAAARREYLRGRRDERLLREIDPSPSDGEARYPLIIETCADGTKRRLDR